MSDSSFHPARPPRSRLDAVEQLLRDRVAGLGRVLEIDPGPDPLAAATDVLVTRGGPPPAAGAGTRVHVLEPAARRLPFDDGTFDFVCCRYVLQAAADPAWLCGEMARVGRGGFVETPSPVAECARRSDPDHPAWRGSPGSRFIVWADADNTLQVVPKAPVVQRLSLGDDSEIDTMLAIGPLYWNTYHFWQASLPVRVLEFGRDYRLEREYAELLVRAMQESVDRNIALAQEHGLPY